MRCCLLSGGLSRRMGRDKALLSHPEGGCWLTRTLSLLAGLNAPLTLCSAHPGHRRRVAAMPRAAGWPPVEFQAEPEPGAGPLAALDHLMGCYPQQLLLLCAVDMPWLDAATLLRVRDAARRDPMAIQIATDGIRLHPLLGLYPARADLHADLGGWLAEGHRRLLGWLARHPVQPLAVKARAVRNCNHPGDWPHS